MKRMVLALAVLASLVCVPAFAQTPPPQGGHDYDPLARWKHTTVSFRHYRGGRYLSLRSLQVREQPEATAHILAEVPRARLVYAEPTAKPGWMAVYGAGARRYPDSEHDVSPGLPLVGGKLALPEQLDLSR